MTYRPWLPVADDPAACHLVAVRLVPKAADEPSYLMASLIQGLGAVGDFALLTQCEEAGAVLLCAFSRSSDARSLARAVAAVEIDTYPGWRSQYGFTLDKATAQVIADALEASGQAAANDAVMRRAA